MQDGQARAEFLEVRERRIVRALARASTRRHLTPFFRRAATTSEAAREAGESLRTFSNKVEALLRMGLLLEVGRTPRKGRAMRRFQTAALSFFIPLEAFPPDLFVTGEAAYQRLFTDSLFALAARFSDGPSAPVGFRVAAGPQREAEFNIAAHPSADFDPLADDQPVFLTSWNVLALDEVTARSLQRELLALMTRYRALQTPAGRPYLTRWGLVPVDRSRKGLST